MRLSNSSLAQWTRAERCHVLCGTNVDTFYNGGLGTGHAASFKDGLFTARNWLAIIARVFLFCLGDAFNMHGRGWGRGGGGENIKVNIISY